MLLAATAVTTIADAVVVHWQGAGVTDTGNIAPSGSVVSLQIGTYHASGAYGFVKGIGGLALANGTLAGFFRQSAGLDVGSAKVANFTPGTNYLNFVTNSSNLVNNAVASSDNIFAFSFTSSAVNGGNRVYGWAQVDVSSSDPFGSSTIVAWAYDDTGAAITLGAIPEPSGLALLAAGAAGGFACFHRFRKRRRPDKAAAA